MQIRVTSEWRSNVAEGIFCAIFRSILDPTEQTYSSTTDDGLQGQRLHRLVDGREPEPHQQLRRPRRALPASSDEQAGAGHGDCLSVWTASSRRRDCNRVGRRTIRRWPVDVEWNDWNDGCSCLLLPEGERAATDRRGAGDELPDAGGDRHHRLPSGLAQGWSRVPRHGRHQLERRGRARKETSASAILIRSQWAAEPPEKFLQAWLRSHYWLVSHSYCFRRAKVIICRERENLLLSCCDTNNTKMA